MTCRTLFALISAAVLWNLPNNILAQAKQDGSEQTPDASTDAKEPAGSVLQMQAKKTPAKAKPKAKKGKAAAKPAKSKAKPKAALKAAPKAIAKPAPKPAPKPVPPPAPKPQPKPAPYFPPAPPVDEELPVELPPQDPTRFQVPLPEEKGDLNIWATQPDPNSAAFDPNAVNNQFGLIAVGNYLGAGLGLEYLRRSFTWMDWGLQITSTQAGLTESKNPDTDEFLNSRLTAARLNARFFNSRWLYFASGLSFNSIQGTYGWKGQGVANEKIETDFKATLIMLDVALGSQWEPGKGFYIGVDWIGIGLPVSGSISYDTNKDLDDLTEILTGSEAEDRIRNELSTQFRPFYLMVKFGYML